MVPLVGKVMRAVAHKPVIMGKTTSNCSAQVRLWLPRRKARR